MLVQYLAEICQVSPTSLVVSMLCLVLSRRKNGKENAKAYLIIVTVHKFLRLFCTYNFRNSLCLCKTLLNLNLFFLIFSLVYIVKNILSHAFIFLSEYWCHWHVKALINTVVCMVWKVKLQSLLGCREHVTLPLVVGSFCLFGWFFFF